MLANFRLEALHPETAQGGNQRGPCRQFGETDGTPRFTQETATVIGKSERTVQRDAERGRSPGAVADGGGGATLIAIPSQF